MGMDNQTLNTWIKQFRHAAAESNEDGRTDSYEVIKQECRGTVQRVKATSGELGEFVEEISDSKLYYLLLSNKFDPDDPNAHFRAYYRKALVNEVCSEARRRHREKKIREHTWIDTALSSIDPEQVDLGELLATYAERKRKLIDGLRLSAESRMATLLIDQRQRMARLIWLVRLVVQRRDCPPQTEAWERWSTNDHQRVIVEGLSLHQVWEVMAKKIMESDIPIEQQLVVDSVRELRGRMTPCNWRQRVSRYRADIADQLDESECMYFLFH
jgi:hypothetical protein